MPDKIIHLRSLIAGAIPTTSSLGIGELAINVNDGKIFLRQSGSLGDTIQSVVTTNSITSGSITISGSVKITGSLNAISITGSLFGTASWANTASYALNAVSPFPYSGSADITGSLYVIGPSNIVSIPTYQSTDFFLIRNATTTFKVNQGIQITSSATIPFQINNEASQSILQVSQSGLITFATFSVDATGVAPNGGVYFTSASMYIGLD